MLAACTWFIQLSLSLLLSSPLCSDSRGWRFDSRLFYSAYQSIPGQELPLMYLFGVFMNDSEYIYSSALS